MPLGTRMAAENVTIPSGRSEFALYVEGPRDRGLVETWAKIRSRALARWVARETVILGGSQPQRAALDFASKQSEHPGSRALCLLDRDRGELDLESCVSEGLEFFVWPRRHIESYLLVPRAIQRSLRVKRKGPRARAPKRRVEGEDRSVEAFFAAQVPGPNDESDFAHFDAKALFSERGLLSEYLGQSVLPSRVAKAMVESELHRDVVAFLDLLVAGVGIGQLPQAIYKPKDVGP